ncbi:hypothetical protein CHH28_18305 [Bacterioplanes sanyensis]|uniref:DUF2797 domain-containing protein n=1 Tax=Bacterioplanes sanyensis TaxID=1249553 RepID=A0A222FNY3_9GAMM|nr:DUF2797 domain-containing protein [Bacterioplanes sanyensis]ASP40500.1 hypothetical protein CHH28_18305 [Bacterioplanes sanyensis]
MGTFEGQLSKLQIQVGDGGEAQYSLVLDDQPVVTLNPHVGEPIRLSYQGQIQCQHCGRATKKSYSQGFCYPCFISLAQCDRCMMAPETCHFHQGTCRDEQWAQQVCFRDHIVYLANSSGVKVGITRATQVPTRWLDQGASQALAIARTANRRLAGLLEDTLRQCLADKTNWRALLKGEAAEVDLLAVLAEVRDTLQQPLQALQDQYPDELHWLLESVWQVAYPVQQYPTKVVSHNFDKTPEVSGRLLGMKGQYLILDTGVINLRKFSAYRVAVSVGT